MSGTLETLDQWATVIGTGVSIIQALGIIIPAAVALWAWLKALRSQHLDAIVPAVVALVQDAKKLSWAADGKPVSDVAGLVAKNLQELARTRGLGELTPAEVAHGTQLASALHKAAKLDADGYTGAPDPAPAALPPAAATAAAPIAPAGAPGN